MMKIRISFALFLFFSCRPESNCNEPVVLRETESINRIDEKSAILEKKPDRFNYLKIDTLEQGYKINRYDGEGYERYNLLEIFFVKSLNEDLEAEENRFGNYFHFMLDSDVLHISGSYEGGKKNGLWLTRYEDSPLLDLVFYEESKKAQKIVKKIENRVVKDDLDRIVIEIIQFIPKDKLHYKLYSYNPTLPHEILSISEYVLENISEIVVLCKSRFADNAALLENATFDSFLIKDGEITYDEFE